MPGFTKFVPLLEALSPVLSEIYFLWSSSCLLQKSKFLFSKFSDVEVHCYLSNRMKPISFFSSFSHFKRISCRLCKKKKLCLEIAPQKEQFVLASDYPYRLPILLWQTCLIWPLVVSLTLAWVVLSWMGIITNYIEGSPKISHSIHFFLYILLSFWIMGKHLPPQFSPPLQVLHFFCLYFIHFIVLPIV